MVIAVLYEESKLVSALYTYSILPNHEVFRIPMQGITNNLRFMVTGVSAVLHSSTTHSPARQYGGALVRQTLILLSLGVSSLTVDIYIFVDLQG